MADHARRSTAADTAALLVSPLALIALLVLMAAIWLRGTLIARLAGGFSTGESSAAMIGLVSLALGLALQVLFAALQFALSRSLGGPPGSARRPDVAIWLALTVLAIIVASVTSAIVPLLFMAGFADVARLPLIVGGAVVIVRLALFPLLAFLAGLAHAGRKDGFGALVGYLFGPGVGFIATFAAVSLACVALPVLMQQSGVSAGPALIVSAFTASLWQVSYLVLTIGAYRAFRLASDAPSGTFR